MTGIKICGITREEDLPILERLEITAIGIVFTESPRQVLMGKARELVTSIRRMQPVEPEIWGVFANEPSDMIREYEQFLGLDAIQLHGPEYTIEDVKKLKSLNVVRGINFAGLKDEEEIEANMAAGARMILLDAPRYSRHSPCGGTGRTVDWVAAAEIARRYPVVLSGGLTYRNVREAVRSVRPLMVDVSSGVEMAPGLKDRGLIEKFVEEVRSVW